MNEGLQVPLAAAVIVGIFATVWMLGWWQNHREDVATEAASYRAPEFVGWEAADLATVASINDELYDWALDPAERDADKKKQIGPVQGFHRNRAALARDRAKKKRVEEKAAEAFRRGQVQANTKVRTGL